MNRILTAAAAFVASSAGVAGLAGTATADPAPGLPAAPLVHHSVDDGMGTVRAMTRSVGHVVPASERAQGDSLVQGDSGQNGTARSGLPLLGQIQNTPLDPVLNTVGSLVGKTADPAGAAAQPQQQNGGLSGSSLGVDPTNGNDGLPGANMLGGLSGGNDTRSGLPASPHGPADDLMGTAGNLLGSLPAAPINAFGSH